MNGMILTASGRNLLAKALTGKTLHFTRAFVGDGTLGSRTPSSLTTLISPKRELPIHSMNTTGSLGTCEVVLEMSNKGLTQGFFVREYGLFALDPDNSQEILYSYYNKGDEAGYLEGDNGVDIISYTLSIVTVIDQAQNVTATITNSNQYVTASRLEQRITDIFAPYQPAKGFWTYSNGDTERIRPATLEQAKDLILEGVNVKAFNSRLERLEDAINQTLLTLEILQATRVALTTSLKTSRTRPKSIPFPAKSLASSLVMIPLTSNHLTACYPALGIHSVTAFPQNSFKSTALT